MSPATPPRSDAPSPTAPANLHAGEAPADALYYAVASEKLAFQYTRLQAIESRASTQFTIGSTILPVTAGLLASGDSPIDDSAVAQALLLLGAVAYCLLAASFVLSYRINAWDSRPQPHQWTEVTVDRGEAEMQRWLGDAYIEAYTANEPLLQRKARFIGYGLWFLTSEAFMLTVAVLAPFWTRW